MIVIALILGLVLGLWPCEQGFSGHGIGNCQDIDECQDKDKDIKQTSGKKLRNRLFRIVLVSLYTGRDR